MAGSYGGRISLDIPRSRLVAVDSNFENPKSSHLAAVGLHHFNHAVETIVPGSSVPQSLQASLNDQYHYIVKNLDLGRLLEPAFLEAVKSVDIRGISLNRKIDGENVLSLLPTGELLFSLNKITYEQFGLQGTPSTVSPKMRFHVRVNMRDKSFVPGKKVYERVKWCLTDRLGLNCDWAFVYQVDDKVAMKVAQTAMEKLEAEKTHTEVESKTYTKLQVPEFDVIDFQDNEILLDVYEWIGGISCHMDITGTADSYHNSMVCPKLNSTIDSVVTKRWRGFLNPAEIRRILNEAKEIVENKLQRWIIINVWGLQDSPVSWGSQEHGFGVDGSNHYTFLCLSGGRYIYLMAVDPFDVAS